MHVIFIQLCNLPPPPREGGTLWELLPWKSRLLIKDYFITILHGWGGGNFLVEIKTTWRLLRGLWCYNAYFYRMLGLDFLEKNMFVLKMNFYDFKCFYYFHRVYFQKIKIKTKKTLSCCIHVQWFTCWCPSHPLMVDTLICWGDIPKMSPQHGICLIFTQGELTQSSSHQTILSTAT